MLESVCSLGFSRESTSSFRGRPRKMGRAALMRMKCCELKGKPAALLLHWIVSSVDSGSFHVQTDPSSVTGSWVFVRKRKPFHLWMTSSQGLVFLVMWTVPFLLCTDFEYMQKRYFSQNGTTCMLQCLFFKGLR